MGFGRKVGAFLGLVPEDGGNGEYTDDYRGEHYEEFEGSEYAGEFGRDYGSEYATAGYSGATGLGDHHPEPVAAHTASRSADRYHVRADAGRGDAPYGEPVTQGALAMQPVPQPRRDLDSKAGNRPITIKLTGFAEARVIGEKYRDGQSVIMDMTEMTDADARRLVDFAAGLAFAKRGSIDKVTAKVFMLLPSDIDAADISLEQRREYAGAYSR